VIGRNRNGTIEKFHATMRRNISISFSKHQIRSILACLGSVHYYQSCWKLKLLMIVRVWNLEVSIIFCMVGLTLFSCLECRPWPASPGPGGHAEKRVWVATDFFCLKRSRCALLRLSFSVGKVAVSGLKKNCLTPFFMYTKAWPILLTVIHFFLSFPRQTDSCQSVKITLLCLGDLWGSH